MTTHALTALSTTVPVRITPPGVHSGFDITIQNVNNTGFVYIGGEGVSSTNYGYRIAPDNAISFELNGKDALYAIAGDADSFIAVLKTQLESGS